MIPLTLGRIAEVVDGRVLGSPDVVVDAPASIDSRAVDAGGLFVALSGEHVDGHDYVPQAIAAGAAGVLASRDVEAPAVVVDDVQTALGRLARHVRGELADLHAIGITGSQGKTSVKDLVAHLLATDGPTVATRGSFNNELGLPLTVLRATEHTEYLVVEMGARGRGHIAELCAIATPEIGAVLNVGHAHVSEFGSPAETAVAKGELVEALPASGTAILNADDPLVAPMADRTDATVLTFGAAGDVAVSDIRLDGLGEPTFTLSHDGESIQVHVPQPGAHVADNAAAAVTIAVALGLRLDQVAEGLASAAPASAMRMQRDVRDDGLLVVNDAYNANPESMSAALRSVAAMRRGRRVAVLGEMLELGDASPGAHHDVGVLAAELGFDRVVVVGDGAAPIVDGAETVSPGIAVLVPDVDVAVRTLSAWLDVDDVVLVKASRGCRLERVAEALLHGRDTHVG